MGNLLDVVLDEVCRGQFRDRAGIEVAPMVFFDHRKLAATSTGTGVTTFFVNATTDGIKSNWPSANGLPSNQRFALESVGFDIEPNCDDAGAYTTAPDTYQIGINATGLTAVSSVAPSVIDGEVKRRILNNGRYEVRDQNFVFLQGYGLRHLSMGVGADGFIVSSLAGAFTAANQGSVGSSNVNNGSPWQGNRQQFKPRRKILPGVNVSATLTFGTSITGLSVASNRLGFYMFGWLIQGRAG